MACRAVLGLARGFSASTPTDLRNAAHCFGFVKVQDFEGYLAGLVLPCATASVQDPARRAYFAVRALNVEASRARDLTSNPAVARVRLDHLHRVVWDALLARPGAPVHAHPVAQELAAARAAHVPLSARRVLALVEARQRDLDARGRFVSLDAMEAFADETAGNLLRVALALVGEEAEADGPAAHAVVHVGKAVGLTTLLRGVPSSLAERCNPLPPPVMAAHRLSDESLFALAEADSPTERRRLAPAVLDVATVAMAHVDAARRVQPAPEARARLALLPAVMSRVFLKRLERHRFDLFDAKMHRRGVSFFWNVFRAYRSKRFDLP